MGKQSVDVKGLDDVTRNLDRAGAELPAAVDGINNTLAERIAADARPRSPVLTGQLQGSIEARGDEVIADTDYAAAVHLRVPFLYDARDAVNPVDAYPGMVDTWVEGVWRG